MKTKSLFFLLISFVMFCYQAKSQVFEVPENYELNSDEDYIKYEKDVIACANWMESTPLNTEGKNWSDAEIFLIKWTSGDPNGAASLDVNVFQYFQENPKFKFIFLAALTRYSLQNKESNDCLKGYFEGFKSIINVYKRGVGVNKSKDMEKVVKTFNKGKLENWVKENY